MRSVWFCLAACIAASGQTTRSYTFDGFGDRMRGPEIDVQGDSTTELMQTLNGRNVPVQKVEERVLRTEGATKVVERVIHNYDQTGAPAGTERMVEEITKQPDGSGSVRSSLYRRDLNGNMALAQRSITDIHRSGTTETATTIVERRSIDGTFQVAEKREMSAQESPSRDVKSLVVYERDENGRFRESERQTVEMSKNGDSTSENTARYLVGTSGRLELATQTVRNAVKHADGSQSVIEDVFSQQTPGLANSGTGPHLKEQRIIERRASGNGVTEITSLRQPSLADPTRLGPARKVSETVCSGKCRP